jgi:hypothetical protein
MMDIVNDIYTLLFVLSTLVIIRNLFFLIRSLRMEEKFKIERSSLVILGLSISYFITSIINILK